LESFHQKKSLPVTMANTGVVAGTTTELVSNTEPSRPNNKNDSSRSHPTVANAASTPKLDVLCTVLEIDEHFKKEMIDWTTIKDLKSSAKLFTSSSSCSKLAAAVLLTAVTSSRDSSSRENRGDVNPQRCNSPPKESQRELHTCVASKSFFEPGALGRPLPRPPMLPNSLYEMASTPANTDKKRKFELVNNSNAANNMFHCKAKVYLPSGKSLDVVPAPSASSSKRAAVFLQRCTDLRMDPLSPPPFALPKRPMGFLPR
jgi:hypothetical protein